jgi:hypothetical protein
VVDGWHGPVGYGVTAVFFVVVIAGLIWIVFFPPGKPLVTGTGSTPAPATAPAESTLTSDAMPSPAVDCPPQDPIEFLPEQVLSESYITTWYPVGAMAAPSSPAAGPTQARRCFARTPEGALYAAVTRLAEEAANTGLVQQAAAQGVTDIRFSGYRWQSYTPDKAIVVVRLAASNGVDTHQAGRVLDVTWADNDWQVVPDDTAAAASAAADPKRIYTPWGGS